MPRLGLWTKSSIFRGNAWEDDMDLGLICSHFCPPCPCCRTVPAQGLNLLLKSWERKWNIQSLLPFSSPLECVPVQSICPWGHPPAGLWLLRVRPPWLLWVSAAFTLLSPTLSHGVHSPSRHVLQLQLTGQLTQNQENQQRFQYLVCPAEI